MITIVTFVTRAALRVGISPRVQWHQYPGVQCCMEGGGCTVGTFVYWPGCVWARHVYNVLMEAGGQLQAGCWLVAINKHGWQDAIVPGWFCSSLSTNKTLKIKTVSRHLCLPPVPPTFHFSTYTCCLPPCLTFLWEFEGTATAFTCVFFIFFICLAADIFGLLGFFSLFAC